MMMKMKNLLFAACVCAAMLAGGCGEESTTTTTGGSAADTSTPAAAPAPPTTTGEHARIPIGQATQAGLKLVATMDSPVKPGGEGAFDVVITGGKPKAVRFWVGTEDVKGSVKAKAEEEATDNWHTHAEVPDPLPAGSKFWVEVEPPTGDKFTTSFDLKVESAAP